MPEAPNVVDGHFENGAARPAGAGGPGRGGRPDTPTSKDKLERARAKLYEKIKNALDRPKKLYDDQVQYELGSWLQRSILTCPGIRPQTK